MAVSALLGAFGYYLYTREEPMQEITFNDLIFNYVPAHRVSLITIQEDKAGEVFKYKAIIQLVDGKKHFIILPNVQHFLNNLGQTQQQMGKGPLEMIPIKYASDTQQSPWLNYVIGGLFVYLLVKIYQARHGRTGGGSSANKTNNSGSSFGRGGLNDMMGMSKSNVQVFGIDKKIKVRFKHVAGMESAKVEVTEFVDFLKNPQKY